MKCAPILVIVAFATSATVCYAGESNTKLEELTSTQLGDYSLKLETDEPQKIGVADPSALTPLRRDTVKPFLGLKLSRPLPDNFWNFTR